MSTQIPRGYRLCENKEILAIYAEVVAEVQRQGKIDYSPKLYLFKSTRTWGWARYDFATYNICEGGSRKVGYSEYNKPIVALNEIFLKDPQKARKTICHEMAHICEYERAKRLHERHECHNYYWRKMYYEIASKFGYTWNDITRCSTYDGLNEEMKSKRNEKHYEIYCPHCGKVYTSSRKSKSIKYPEKYKCGACGGILSPYKDKLSPRGEKILKLREKRERGLITSWEFTQLYDRLWCED